MKKIFMVFSLVCACCFVTNVANAIGQCRLTSCGAGGQSDDSILSTTGKIGKAALNEGQCYRCNWGDNAYECPEGTVLALKHRDYATNGEIIGIYKCEDEGASNDTWKPYDPVATCDPSTGTLPSTAKNTRSYFSINGGSTTGSVWSYDSDSLILQSTSDGCVMYVCKEGYKPNAENTDCISLAAEQEAEERQKQEQERQKQEQERQKQEQERQKQEQQQSKKNKCKNSGGSWTSGKCVCNRDLMIESNGVCVCTSNEYEIKDGYCVMKDSVMKQKTCLAAAGTTWNSGECKCNASTYSWNGTQCVEDPNIVAKNKIIAAAGKLDSMFAKFEVSKWKNEEGEFNTARLASDSIAGVVLGTTGGLITSSVMKKKQVEQGFEDLRCVVGGQSVAGWGDEFMVGIQ